MSCVFQALPVANRKRYFSFFQALPYFSFTYLPCKIMRKVKLHACGQYTDVKVLKSESEATFFRKRSVQSIDNRRVTPRGFPAMFNTWFTTTCIDTFIAAEYVFVSGKIQVSLVELRFYHCTELWLEPWSSLMGIILPPLACDMIQNGVIYCHRVFYGQQSSLKYANT